MKLYEDLVYRDLIKDISSPELERLLNEESLTFYIGTDPTADSMHIGHYSSFLIAKRLKDYGHNPILLVGGATALIGDPRPSSEREIIDKDKVIEYAKVLEKQVKDIFGFKVVNNYEWSKDLNFMDFLRDYGKYFTVNMMLEKDIIKRRLETGITYTEFSYMIMQAMDFHHLFVNHNCILQVAGSDQWGNITAGIELIRKREGKEAYGFTMPLVEDKYGEKFGKSEGNAIWLDKEKTSSYEMYQFLFNVDDTLVERYLKQLTFLTKEKTENILEKHNEAPEKRVAQKELAKEVITFLHGEEEFNKAMNVSEKIFSSEIYTLSTSEIISSLKGIPNFEIENINIEINDFLVKYNICSSKREVREMIEAGAISINNEKVNDYNLLLNKNMGIEEKVFLIKKGKKKYYLGQIKNIS
jgi:tyrosyl-tRNA synthetase